MAGHNKWAQIKHKKAITDAKRSKIFTKLARLVTVEAKKAKGDHNAPGLRNAVEKARKENMPNENIERAIKKATESDAAMESITYEGYGPGGTGIIVEVLTDSRNRASHEIKHLFSKNGGTLGAIGSVVWSFTRENAQSDWTPTTLIPLSDEDAEKLSLLVDELENNDDIQSVFTNAE